MNDRTHSYLDGELPLSALSPEERAEFTRFEAVAGLVAGHVWAQPVPDLTSAVMARLPDAPARAAFWRRALAWWWAPHPIRLTLRPAYALAGLAALLLVAPRADDLLVPVVPQQPAGIVQVRDAAPVYVQFRLEAPSASRVELAGSFTGWQPRYELHETAPGEWSALVPLDPGVHDYAFLVDGKRWVADPNAPQVDDSFGGTNSRLSLPPMRGDA